MNIMCKDCFLPMGGPNFEKKHSEPTRLVIVHDRPRIVALANCYYECPKCKGRTVFDPRWRECTSGEKS